MQVLTLLSIHPHSFDFLFIFVVFWRNVNAYAVYNKQQFGYACGIFGYSFSLISEIYCGEISMNIWNDSKTQVFEQNKFLESSYRAVLFILQNWIPCIVALMFIILNGDYFFPYYMKKV